LALSSIKARPRCSGGAGHANFGARIISRASVWPIFLDTLPYNEGTTTSGALRAGLPMLTCSGAALALRLATEPGLLTGLAQRLARNRSTVPPFDPAQAFDRESFIDGGLTPASIFFTIFSRPSRKTAVSGGARPGRRYR